MDSDFYQLRFAETFDFFFKMARGVVVAILVVMQVFHMVATLTHGFSDETGNQENKYLKSATGELQKTMDGTAHDLPIEEDNMNKRVECPYSNPAMCSGMFGKRRARSIVD